MLYSQAQWLLFFFFYCFLGWIWECIYMSALQGQLVNRGFLHGPFIPIYGYGAMIVLWLTWEVRENILLIFLTGMCGATVLEYITGLAGIVLVAVYAADTAVSVQTALYLQENADDQQVRIRQ